MDHPHRPQRINAHTGRTNGPSRSEQLSWFPVTSPAKPHAQPSRSSSLQSYYTAPYSLTPPYVPSPPIVPPLPNVPSPAHGQRSTTSYQTYYSANTSPLSYLSTNSSSTPSSTLSVPFSVTSINSYKSRKNVWYPRRAHPSLSEHSVSPDALIWQVRFLCTTLLPYAEKRMMPAGNVLLQSLGPQEDFSQRLPVMDEGTLCCSELFIALTHEVLLKDAVSAGQLEGPCKRLHKTFKDILLKQGAFSLPATRMLDEDHKTPSAGVLALERFSSVLRALCSIMDAFEEALVSVKPAAAKDGALGDHHRMALLELSVSTGLTMEQYRKKLEQNLSHNQAQLNSLRQSEGLLSPTNTTSIPLHFKGVPKIISTIEEASEADGEGSSTNGHVHTHSTHSHTGSTRSDSDSGKRSLPRRILRRLIPSSMGRKEG